MPYSFHNNKARYIELLEKYIKSNIPNQMLHKNEFEIVDPNIKIN